LVAMCDSMYYEYKLRAKNLAPEEPELEKAEEQPMVIKS
jgi:hypothetical protein